MSNSRNKLHQTTNRYSFRAQGCNLIDILGLAQFCAQVMFGVLRHISTCSALELNLAQNAAQFGAQFCAQDF